MVLNCFSSKRGRLRANCLLEWSLVPPNPYSVPWSRLSYPVRSRTELIDGRARRSGSGCGRGAAGFQAGSCAWTGCSDRVCGSRARTASLVSLLKRALRSAFSKARESWAVWQHGSVRVGCSGMCLSSGGRLLEIRSTWEEG